MLLSPRDEAPDLCVPCGETDSSPQLVMVSQPPPAMPRCRRLSYIVLGVLFGILGVHNFVAGRSGRGIAQLLVTCLSVGVLWRLLPVALVGAWVLVEICLVDTDGNGARMV